MPRWGQPAIYLSLRHQDATEFARITAASVGQALALVSNGRVIVAASVTSPISHGTIQMNDMTMTALQLAALLRDTNP